MANRTKDFILYLSLPLIMLFAYTAVSKLQDLEAFRKALLNQPLPDAWAKLLVWGIPISELLAAFLLLFTSLRTYGFALASLLMGLFTAYAGLILSGSFGYIPCSCGGLLESLSWQQHLWLNSFYWILSLTGFFLSKRQAPSTPPA